MSNMVGVGPFITIPLLMAAMGGPQSLLGWLVGALIVICDGQVWSELGAAWPGSGGSYRFLREAYGRDRWGRPMAFLFIWSFILSGPLEIASGLIGFGQYTTYLWPGLAGGRTAARGRGRGRPRRPPAGAAHLVPPSDHGHALGGNGFDPGRGHRHGLAALRPARAFDFPIGAFAFNRGFVLGLGSATLIAIYDYLGYYDICYIGDEVRRPGTGHPALDPLLDPRLRARLLPSPLVAPGRPALAADADVAVRGVGVHGEAARPRAAMVVIRS